MYIVAIASCTDGADPGVIRSLLCKFKHKKQIQSQELTFSDA